MNAEVPQPDDAEVRAQRLATLTASALVIAIAGSGWPPRSRAAPRSFLSPTAHGQ